MSVIVLNYDSNVCVDQSRAVRPQFEVSDDADSVQMLTRSTQIGEFYVMGPPIFKPDEGTIGFMDLYIYDEESDRHVRIPWEAAVAATCLNSNGCIGASTATFQLAAADGTDALTSKEWLDAAALFCIANRSGKKDDIKNAFNYGVAPTSGTPKAAKVYITLCRPFIEHMMHSAIVAVAGRDTGATLFGPAGVLLSHDADPHYSLTHANHSLSTSSPIPALHRHADLG